MVEMISIENHKFDGKLLKPGDIFKCDEKYVAPLLRLGRAKEKADDGKPGNSAPADANNQTGKASGTHTGIANMARSSGSKAKNSQGK